MIGVITPEPCAFFSRVGDIVLSWGFDAWHRQCVAHFVFKKKLGRVVLLDNFGVGAELAVQARAECKNITSSIQEHSVHLTTFYLSKLITFFRVLFLLFLIKYWSVLMWKQVRFPWNDSRCLNSFLLGLGIKLLKLERGHNRITKIEHLRCSLHFINSFINLLF